jgi:hypothetical protein
MSQRAIPLWLAVVLVACGPSSTNPGDDSGDDDGAGAADAAVIDVPDAAFGGPDAPLPADAAACTATEASAEEAFAPVDIIWVVDSSGSMDDEASAVQNALNGFSSYIAAQGIDYRVILIGDAGAMTVPPPLGGSPRFLHVNVTVNSTDALEKIVSAYPMYQSFLRPGAGVHFVVVTDDESDWSKAQFDAALAGLSAPGIPAGYTFHAVCSEEVPFQLFPPPVPPVMLPCSGGLGAGGAAAPGKVYIGMTMATGGLWKSICTSDWTPIFSAVAQAVSVPVPLPCTFQIPPPPGGMALDPDQVNFVYTPTGGSDTVIPQKSSAAACGAGQGWYYDDPASPTQIIACPATCTALTADPSGEVHIEFGCSSIIDG